MRGTFPIVKENGNYKDTDCQYSEVHMDSLINATNNVANEVKSLNGSITTLNSHHKDIIKYLMIVVCVIALGKSALELIPQGLSKAVAIMGDGK